MAAHPNPALVAELLAALAVLDPQIRGLTDLAATPKISDPLLAEINNLIAMRQTRKNLIQKVIDDLGVVVADLALLYADGYPALPPVLIGAPLLQELNKDLADITAASEVFASNAPTQIVGDPATIATEDQPLPIPL